MLKEELAELSVGTEISLDLYCLWQDKFDRNHENCPLRYEGYLKISPSDYEGWDNPYIDLYTSAGRVACDGETCEVIEVDPNAERITMQSEDWPAAFEMDFEDAQYCVHA